MNKLILKLTLISAVVFLSSCGGDSDPGYEFMPNMYRSPSWETYGENAITGMNAQLPVEGTISRDHLSTFNYDGSVEGYLLAGDSAVYPIEKDSLNIADGKALYGMFCEHCHGATGSGDGTITHPVYNTSVPHYNDTVKLRERSKTTMSNLKAGHIFHAITYGVPGAIGMGSHSSQISQKERWKITLYVQELQHYGQN